jgi:hypothetical protein
MLLGSSFLCISILYNFLTFNFATSSPPFFLKIALFIYSILTIQKELASLLK